MKTLTAILLATALLLSLAGCNFNGMFSDSTGTKEMEAKQQVTDMLEALANKDLEAALALMHPDVLADAEKKADVTEKLQQMMNFLNGRKSLAEEQQNLNVRSGNGTSGAYKQENAAFKITLEDETVYVAVLYLTQNGSSGFTSYQLVLGVV